MSEIFTKENVLSRRELDITDIDPKHFRQEGIHPDNQFWQGGKCYTPVIYRSQPFKLRIFIIPADNNKEA